MLASQGSPKADELLGAKLEAPLSSAASQVPLGLAS